MPLTQISCHNCGTRQDADLNDFEIRNLQSQGRIVRYCQRCAGNTHWVSRGATGTTRIGAPDLEKIRGGRILLIDDDEDILKILGKVLGKEKFELDMASTGREAIVKLGREDYDLILSDIRMPEFDGKQLFAFLDQNLPEYKDKVIFLTGDTGNPDTMKFLEETKCPYMTKPIEIPVLIRILYQYFSQ
jgi:CheY-like chemotaxis protein